MGGVFDDKVVSTAVERHHAALVRYALSILGDAELAQDVVQDTFMKLCRDKPEQANGNLAPWLFTVCRNRALDVLRGSRSVRSLNDADLQVPETAPRALATLEQREQIEAVLKAIAGLPDKEREVLTLKFHCDLSYKEISRITGHSVSYVGFLIHGGVRQVRAHLAARSKQIPKRRLS